ncbi:MAG: hypothetical protein M0R41_10675 [Methylobacter tundripaludum]|uniref:Uncharacterized protein n=1 Tax=Methylobacter tundripaludum TaxID=173365 RepID=A0A2S6H4B3_9GAMM|nr:hypothetical protein [Methylobacter tundripaludum]MCK9636730.1 hypothetical protein [Methylobacter tundripaludum]PPK72294.1 hypothetical protein B0F88_10486 [Methylobacter tundripaludum]
MNTKSNTADLSHRLSVAKIADKADLNDTVGPMDERTLDYSIVIQFENARGGRISDELAFGAL